MSRVRAKGRAGAGLDAAPSFPTDGFVLPYLEKLRQFAYENRMKCGESKKLRRPLAQSGKPLTLTKDEHGALVVTCRRTGEEVLRSTPDRKGIVSWLGRVASPTRQWGEVNHRFHGTPKHGR